MSALTLITHVYNAQAGVDHQVALWKRYDPALLKKPRLVVANKMDVPEAAGQLAKFKRKYKTVDVMEISCATGDGLERLKKELLKRVTRFARG